MKDIVVLDLVVGRCSGEEIATRRHSSFILVDAICRKRVVL